MNANKLLENANILLKRTIWHIFASLILRQIGPVYQKKIMDNPITLCCVLYVQYRTLCAKLPRD